MIVELKKDYMEIFGQEPERAFFAPGRVNLIGEHTDYNGGNVFPCALNIGTYGLVKERQDNKIRLYSKNFNSLGVIEVSLDNLDYDKIHDWANYPKGVISVLKKAGYEIKTGFDVLFYGNIPNGAGLSSSASIELCTAIILNNIYNMNIDKVERVKYCKQAENEYIGVNCGIMDQFIIGMGKENCAVLLDTNTITYTYVPLILKDALIVIANTNKRRTLADSKYNERRGECNRALESLQKVVNINNLCDLNLDLFEKYKSSIEDEVCMKRAHHAISENERTKKAVKVLKEGNLEAFGMLMKASHDSLKDDYEVTGKELDTLVELAWKQEGLIGSRMTGAGFGGCTVSIVKEEYVEEFIKNVGIAYKKEIGYEADFYKVKVGDGTREISI
ncbi:galactokinase [Clostridium cavendishii DSM 21758]|uniref:Galactokinase n=2 Tax=Clostridium TaxID=1485 RepID=A0A1M6UIG7_9CLOT|nr:galactokinase [Clostridium cavendishii]SHK68950.1 galactokinase [Clostridium cavendishii DSM 21758]